MRFSIFNMPLMKTLRLPNAAWTTIEEAAAAHAESFPHGSGPRAEIFQALNHVKQVRPRVLIEVEGGVAYITRYPAYVNATIKDND